MVEEVLGGGAWWCQWPTHVGRPPTLVVHVPYRASLRVFASCCASMPSTATHERAHRSAHTRGHMTTDGLGNNGRAWQNYGDYRPLVEYAKAARIPVIAANAPRR